MQLKRALNGLPRTLGEFAVVMAVFALGILVGARLKPAPADWFGFAGALLGATMTVAGSVYVLDRERTREGRERKLLLLGLLAEVHDACLPFQVANATALHQRFGKTVKQQVTELVTAVGRVKAVQQNLKPSSVIMIKVADAVEELHVDTDAEPMAKAAMMYPDSADLGGLNAIAHDVMTQVDTLRALLDRS